MNTTTGEKILIQRSALETENRLGKHEADKFYDRVVYESKNELWIDGDLYDEDALNTRVLARLERKNDYLFELEKKENPAL